LDVMLIEITCSVLLRCCEHRGCGEGGTRSILGSRESMCAARGLVCPLVYSATNPNYAHSLAQGSLLHYVQVLTASHGVLDSDAPGIPAADTLGLEALNISASATVEADSVPTAQAIEPAQSAAARDPGPGPATAAASPPRPLGRVKGNGPAGLVWLSNAAPLGPLPGRPLRKEAEDGQQGMAACG
jgi:hypothetical protein